MVNLEEIMEEGKRFYVSPRMTIDEIDFADVIVTSEQPPIQQDEEGNNDIDNGDL